MRNVVLICVAVAALAAVLSGQGATASKTDMRALVTKIRGLRAHLNRVAAADIRAQSNAQASVSPCLRGTSANPADPADPA